MSLSPMVSAVLSAAQDPNHTIRVWQTGEGLPQNSVTSVVQTPDGYLWVATFNGLARFDGARFTVFDEGNTPALQSSRLVRLDVDHEGTLWIVNEEGGLAQLREGRFRSWTGREGLPADGAAAVIQGPHRTVLLLDRAGGVSRLQGGQWIPDPQCGFLKGNRISLFTDRQERLWVWSSQKRRLGHVAGDQVEWLKRPGQDQEEVVRSFTRSQDGGLWLVLSNQVWHYRCQPEEWKPTGCIMPGSIPYLTCMVEDKAGDLWVSSYGSGVVHFGPGGACERFTTAEGLSHNAVRSLFEDREGSLWVGTDGGGLIRLKRKTVTAYGLRQGLSGEVVMSVLPDQDEQNSLWVGLNGGGVMHLGKGQDGGPVFEPGWLTNAFVYGLFQDRHGGFWLGVHGSGILRYENGRLTQLGNPNAWADKPLLAALEDRSGTIWLGGGFGLLRQQRGELTELNSQLGWSNVSVRALAEDRSGSVYVGSYGKGLSRYKAGQWTHYREKDGLADDHLSCLYIDREDVLWIGTCNGGLSRFREDRLANFTTREGLPSNSISTIIEDVAGQLWLASNRGLFRVDKAQFNELEQRQRQVMTGSTFGLAEGLATLECGGGASPGACRSGDGRLWFATVKGLTVVDPAKLPVDSSPVPVVIEEVIADGRELGRSVLTGKGAEVSRTPGRRAKAGREPLPILSTRGRNDAGPPSTVVIPPGCERVEFRFAGLTFLAPERVRFRYQLEGFDADWLDGENQHLAFYTHLPPGRYVFHVTACNHDGVWDQVGEAVGLLVLPPWWKTWWFQATGAFTICAVFFGWYELRLHRARSHQALQEAFSRQLIASQEQERHRIAGELHDGLGQNLVLIRNRAELALQRLQPPAPVAEQLTEISASAAQSLEEVRNTAHALRPYELERLGLTRAIEDAAQKAAATSTVKFACDLERLDGVFPPEIEMVLFRIVQEGITNVLRHAHATEVIIEMKKESGDLRLTLLDNGCGFHAGDLEPGAHGKAGFGLTNIAARAQMVGGELQIKSAPGRGTALTVRLPIKNQTL